MAAKNYKLTIQKSDGTSEDVSFTIPDTAGTYKLKFTLSNGDEIDAGNITVDDTAHSYDLKIQLSNNTEIDAGTIVTPVVELPTFANATWAEIAAISEAGNAPTTFAVGDEKTIELTTGEQITLVILGFNHDDLSDGSGKAGITIGMKNLLATTYRMNATATNAGSWNDSEMRTSTMATLFSQLQPDLQAIIKSVDKKTVLGSFSFSKTTSSDKLFLFSQAEISGFTDYGYENEGEQYEYWKTVKDGKTSADRIKYLSNGSGFANGWWFRSPLGSSDSIFRLVNSAGFVSHSPASNESGVSFGFCV